jgi:hypothetical protein
VAHSRRQRRGAHGKQLRACSVGPVGTDGSDAVRKGRLPTRPSGWSAQATVHEAEGALGDGRRPGPAQVVVFDEAATGGGPGGTADAVQHLHVATRGGVGQRRRVATEGVRGHVTSSVHGRQRRGREAQHGGATDRSSTRTVRRPLPDERPGLRLRARVGTGSSTMAEAGGSPSSDAPPEGSPEAETPKAGRCSFTRCPMEQASARARAPEGGPRGRKPWRAAPQGVSRGSGHVRESDGPCWVHVVVSRLQKSERSIFLRDVRHAASRARVAKHASASRQAGQPRG